MKRILKLALDKPTRLQTMKYKFRQTNKSFQMLHSRIRARGSEAGAIMQRKRVGKCLSKIPMTQRARLRESKCSSKKLAKKHTMLQLSFFYQPYYQPTLISTWLRIQYSLFRSDYEQWFRPSSEVAICFSACLRLHRP